MFSLTPPHSQLCSPPYSIHCQQKLGEFFHASLLGICMCIYVFFIHMHICVCLYMCVLIQTTHFFHYGVYYVYIILQLAFFLFKIYIRNFLCMYKQINLLPFSINNTAQDGDTLDLLTIALLRDTQVFANSLLVLTTMHVSILEYITLCKSMCISIDKPPEAELLLRLEYKGYMCP